MATLKEKLDWAFTNQNQDPVAKEYVTRYKKGLLNPELTKAGMNPVEIKVPKFDLTGFNAIKQEEGVMSKMTDKTPGKERAEDLIQTAQGIGTTVSEGAENIQKIAGSDTLNFAQKSMGVLGSLMGTGARTIGDVTMGVGKMFLSQDQEDKLKSFVQEKAQGVAETEIAKKVADWYANLDEDDKLIVDSAGGFASLVAEIVGGGTASKVGKEVIETGVDVTKQGIKTGLETAMQGGEALMSKIGDVFTPSQSKLEAEVNSLFEKGVKPSLQGQQTLGQAEKYRDSVISAIKTIDSNKNNIKFIDETGEVTTGRTPQSLQELSEAIDQTKQQIYAQYDNLATQAGEAGVKIDTIKIANELDQVINNQALKLSNPEAVKYAEEVRNRFIKAGELDAKTAQDIIQNYNNSLKAFYRNPTPEGLTRNAVDALMANQMRQALDEGIEGLTGAQYQQLKNQYASLKTIERDVLRATLRDARKNAKGLIDYTDIFSGGQLVTGLLTINPAMVATGVAQKGIAEWFKFLNDPNRAVGKMFDVGSKLEKPDTGIPVSTRKQLEAPEEGSSNISVETPINLPSKTQSTLDIEERANPNIKTPTSSEVTPTNIEQALGNRQIATEELKASMMEASAGMSKTDEGYVRFSSFPSWIPKELRQKELFDRVWKHIENDTYPKEASNRELELYGLLKSRVQQRTYELDSVAQNRLNEAGKPMTWDDTPFGVLLAGGLGAYYMIGGDSSLTPIIAIGALTPQGRKVLVKELSESIRQARKIANDTNLALTQRKAAEKTVNFLTKQLAEAKGL